MSGDGLVDIVSGDSFAAPPVGVLDYSFANFKLLVETTPVPVSGGLAREVTEAPRRGER